MKAQLYPPDDVFPDLHEIDIEGEKVVESVYPEKQYQLLVETLYDSWPGPGGGRPYQAFSGVGLFYRRGHNGLCPDVMLAMETDPGNPEERANRSYFTWESGRAPDYVLEVVSDRAGDEDGHQLQLHHEIGARYDAIYDPRNQLGQQGLLRSFARSEAESAAVATQRAEAETRRADAETHRANRERARVEALEARLRELGLDP